VNFITVFLTIACIAAGLALGEIGQLYIGISFVITAVFIASVPQKANGRLPLIKRSR